MICKQCQKRFVTNHSNKARPVQRFCSYRCARLFQWRNNLKGDTLLQEQVRVKAKNAMKSGKLTRKPCEICGKPADAHHDDYNKPLEVRWLCRKHHFELHQKGNNVKTGNETLTNGNVIIT